METSFSGLLGMSAYLRLIETLFGVQQLFLGLPENIPARHLQRVLQYLLLTSRFSDDCFPTQTLGREKKKRFLFLCVFKCKRISN